MRQRQTESGPNTSRDTAAPLSGCHSNSRQFCSVGRTDRVRCKVGCMRESVCVSLYACMRAHADRKCVKADGQ